jgi:hypothetical protein
MLSCKHPVGTQSAKENDPLKLALALFLIPCLMGQPAHEDLSGKELLAARGLIERTSKALDGVRRVDAEFVQTQESVLLEKPMVSSGLFYLRAQPACLLLKFNKPRAVEVRSDANSHRVYEPTKNRATRLVFESNELAKALVGVFTQEISSIEKLFVLESLITGKKDTTISLRPRSKELSGILTKLQLTIRNSDALVLAMRYTNKEGEATHLRLMKVVLHSKGEKLDQIFDAPLPKAVRIQVRQIKKPSKAE